ncbi:Regulator of RpoS [Thalassocella blandensis]|nr:Regulator of RpoS [Thalassocella blandensis]
MKNVLVVDDDEDYNFLTQEAFDDCNLACNLMFYTRATTALEYLSESRYFPDLILLDINMPVMNGWEFLEEYERLQYHQKHNTLIVVTSSSILFEDKARIAQYARVVEYVDKPLESRHIMALKSKYFLDLASGEN